MREIQSIAFEDGDGGRVFVTNSSSPKGYDVRKLDNPDFVEPFKTEAEFDDFYQNDYDPHVTQTETNIATNAADIATNAADIATNTANIATNTANIATNTADIATLQGESSGNASDISGLQADVATNTTNIATNAADIINLQNSVSTNTGNISTNTSDITNLQNSVSTNAGNISTNAGNISTNTGNIATNTGNISTLQSTTLTRLRNTLLVENATASPIVHDTDPNTTIDIISVSTTSTGTVTVQLATSQTVDGRMLTIKDVSGNAGTNNVTISTEAGELIDGVATQVINTNYGFIKLYSDGTNWFIIG